MEKIYRENLEIGMKAQKTKTITSSDLETFAQVSMDENPIHLDEEVAKNSIFGKRIVHGALMNSFFSAILGCDFPGEGTIYLSQNSKFVKPAFIGETLTAEVELISLTEKKKFYIAEFKTTCRNEKNEIVVEGTALAIPPEKE